MRSKCHAIDAGSIFELEDKINEFSKTNDVFATNIFPTQKGYDCIIWYKTKTAEPVVEKPIGEPATPNQIKALKPLGLYRDGMTKQEAWAIINQGAKRRR